MHSAAGYILASVFIFTHSACADFPVNVRTSLNQAYPAIAAEPSGNFIVVWHSYYQNKSNEIIARFFDNQAQPMGDEFVINQTEEGNQKNADVAMDSRGDFLVTWQRLDPNEHSWVFVRRFDANAVGQDEFRICNEPNGSVPQIALRENGSFVVVWRQWEYWPPFEVHVIRFRLYDVNDTLLSSGQPNLWYNTRNPDVAINSNGQFVVVWMQEDNIHLDSNVIMARLYNPDGSEKTDPFIVSVSPFDTTAEPHVTATADGNFTVTWDGAEFSQYNQIYLRQYNSDGLPLTDELLVNSVTSAENLNPKCSTNDANDLVIIWDRQTSQPQSGTDIFAQQYRAQAEKLGDEFRINTYLYQDQLNPAVCMRDDGTFVAVWQSKGQDGSGGGIFGRVGPLTKTADLNGNGFVDFFDFSVIAPQWMQQGGGKAENLVNDNKIDLKDIAAFCEQWLTYRYSCEQADINGDGSIDFTDFSILAANWGNYGLLAGDIDANGTVDRSDLQWLSLHWAMNCE